MAEDKGKYKPASTIPAGLTSKLINKGNKLSTQNEFAAATKRVMGNPVKESSLPGQSMSSSRASYSPKSEPGMMKKPPTASRSSPAPSTSWSSVAPADPVDGGVPMKPGRDRKY